MRLQDIILQMQRIGVAEVLIPFVLVFTVTFAVLQKAKILGPAEESRKYNVIFALILGMGVIFPHVTGIGPNVVPVINNAIPNIAVVAVGIVMFMFLLGVWGHSPSFKHLGTFIVIFSLGAIIYIFGDAARWGWRIPNQFRWLQNPDTQALLITILVFGLVIWFITRDPNAGRPGSGVGNFFKGIDKALNPYDKQ